MGSHIVTEYSKDQWFAKLAPFAIWQLANGKWCQFCKLLIFTMINVSTLMIEFKFVFLISVIADELYPLSRTRNSKRQALDQPAANIQIASSLFCYRRCTCNASIIIIVTMYMYNSIDRKQSH